jgi:hypothetical protein
MFIKSTRPMVHHDYLHTKATLIVPKMKAVSHIPSTQPQQAPVRGIPKENPPLIDLTSQRTVDAASKTPFDHWYYALEFP